jgi:hypothetical protein
MYDPARDSWEERDGDEARSRRGRLASDQPHVGFSPSEQIHGASGENNNTTDLVSIFLVCTCRKMRYSLNAPTVILVLNLNRICMSYCRSILDVKFSSLLL